MNSHISITVKVFLIAALAAFGITGNAHAEPVMDIIYSSSIADYDEFDPSPHPGNELLISYLVSNNSEPLGENNMIDFTLPAGSNQGVYDATTPTNWTFTINEDNTFFQGSGDEIMPGEQGLFELYSTDLNIHQNFAKFNFRGPPQDYQWLNLPVLTDVPGEFPHTLSADIHFDGIVNLKDFAVLAGQWQMTEPNIVDSSVTHYEDTQDGITVSTNTYLDQGLRIFDYLIQNNSGDTLYEINQIGEDWEGGSGINRTWQVQITDSPVLNEDFIKFYDSQLHNNNNEEFITGSNFLDSWGICQMELKSDAGNTFYVDVLAPLAPVSLEADIIDDGIVDIGDPNALCGQWLNTESWYTP